jgi:hypothetical protein
MKKVVTLATRVMRQKINWANLDFGVTNILERKKESRQNEENVL